MHTEQRINSPTHHGRVFSYDELVQDASRIKDTIAVACEHSSRPGPRTYHRFALSELTAEANKPSGNVMHELRNFYDAYGVKLFADHDEYVMNIPDRDYDGEKFRRAMRLTNLLKRAYSLLVGRRADSVDEIQPQVMVYDSSDKQKFSFHVVLNGYFYFGSANLPVVALYAALDECLDDFIYTFKDIPRLTVDFAPYDHGSLRILNFAKGDRYKRMYMLNGELCAHNTVVTEGDILLSLVFHPVLEQTGAGNEDEKPRVNQDVITEFPEDGGSIQKLCRDVRGRLLQLKIHPTRIPPRNCAAIVGQKRAASSTESPAEKRLAVAPVAVSGDCQQLARIHQRMHGLPKAGVKYWVVSDSMWELAACHKPGDATNTFVQLTSRWCPCRGQSGGEHKSNCFGFFFDGRYYVGHCRSPNHTTAVNCPRPVTARVLEELDVYQHQQYKSVRTVEEYNIKDSFI